MNIQHSLGRSKYFFNLIKWKYISKITLLWNSRKQVFSVCLHMIWFSSKYPKLSKSPPNSIFSKKYSGTFKKIVCLYIHHMKCFSYGVPDFLKWQIFWDLRSALKLIQYCITRVIQYKIMVFERLLSPKILVKQKYLLFRIALESIRRFQTKNTRKIPRLHFRYRYTGLINNSAMISFNRLVLPKLGFLA